MRIGCLTQWVVLSNPRRDDAALDCFPYLHSTAPIVGSVTCVCGQVRARHIQGALCVECAHFHGRRSPSSRTKGDHQTTRAQAVERGVKRHAPHRFIDNIGFAAVGELGHLTRKALWVENESGVAAALKRAPSSINGRARQSVLDERFQTLLAKSFHPLIPQHVIRMSIA